MKNLITIRGTRENLIALAKIRGLIISDNSEEEVSPTEMQISAYADDNILQLIIAGGCLYNVLVSGPDLLLHLANMYNPITPSV